MQRAIGAINWVLMLATLASAVALYAIKHDTRRLEVRVLAQERALERAQNDVTVLTAERAHLPAPHAWRCWPARSACRPSPPTNTCASIPTAGMPSPPPVRSVPGRGGWQNL